MTAFCNGLNTLWRWVFFLSLLEFFLRDVFGATAASSLLIRHLNLYKDFCDVALCGWAAFEASEKYARLFSIRNEKLSTCEAACFARSSKKEKKKKKKKTVILFSRSYPCALLDTLVTEPAGGFIDQRTSVKWWNSLHLNLLGITFLCP